MATCSLYKSDHTFDFGNGGPFRLSPLASCVLSLPRFSSALQVLSNELSPLPTCFPWLTPSNAPQRSPSGCLSDSDTLPLPYLVTCSDLWTDFFPFSLELWHVCPHRQSTLQIENMTPFSLQVWELTVSAIHWMEWTNEFYTFTFPFLLPNDPFNQKGHGHD